MPVISSRTSSTSSYRTSSNYSALSNSTGRYNFGDSSYKSYRSNLSSSTPVSSSTSSSSSTGTSSGYRSRYSDLTDNKTNSLSTRIGSTREPLATLPPSSTYVSPRSNSLSRSSEYSNYRNARSTASSLSDTDFYEKYSASRYQTKYELARSRSLSETKPRDSVSPSKPAASSEIRSVALRNALPPTTSLSSRSWDREYPVSTLSSLYSSRLERDKKLDGGESKNGHDKRDVSTSYTYKGANSSPAKSPPRKTNSSDDSIEKRTANIEGMCGLWNIGNTCYMNSVLQCLSHTNDLTKFARTQSGTGTVSSNGSPSAAKDLKIWNEYIKLINQMWTTSQKSVNPSDLKLALSAKHRMYMGSAQQDAQEFLRYFIDALHGAMNTGEKKANLNIDEDMTDLEKAKGYWEWYTKRENSLVKDLFVGQLKSSLYCCHCEKTSVMCDPFWDLSVPIPSTSIVKIEKCLELFNVKDVMDGNEMPHCDYCNTRRKCIKSFTIQKFPKYLVIHLKRFSEMRWTKLTNVVEFPTGPAELDLTPYASDSMDENDPKPIYSLYAISNHMGSTSGGHYVAQCKHPITKKWHEFNDNYVSDARESSLVSSSAYLLFYERVE